MNRRNRRLDWVLALAVLGLAILPWYRLEAGLFSIAGLGDYPAGGKAAPGLLQLALHGRWWLALPLLALAPAVLARFTAQSALRARLLVASGLAGTAIMVLQGFAITYSGWRWPGFETWFGALGTGQEAFGAGAATLLTTFLLLFSFGLAERGVLRGDAFVVSAITILIALVTTFVFYPVGMVLVGAFQGIDGSFDPSGFLKTLTDPSIWTLRCLSGSGRCGVAWSTLTLAIATGAGSTLLGLAFALVATRTRFPFKRADRKSVV